MVLDGTSIGALSGRVSSTLVADTPNIAAEALYNRTSGNEACWPLGAKQPLPDVHNVVGSSSLEAGYGLVDSAAR